MLDDFRILARTVSVWRPCQMNTQRSRILLSIVFKSTHTHMDRCRNCTHYSHLNAVCWAQYAPYFNGIDFYALIFIFMSFSALFIFECMCNSLKRIQCRFFFQSERKENQTDFLNWAKVFFCWDCGGLNSKQNRGKFLIGVKNVPFKLSRLEF